MFDIDAEEPERNLLPTDFDKIRLEEMLIGDSVNAENGIWTAHRYKKEYFLLINNSKFAAANKLSNDYSFQSAYKLIEFLEKQYAN